MVKIEYTPDTSENQDCVCLPIHASLDGESMYPSHICFGFLHE